MPGSVEAIFRGPSGSDGNANNSNWNMTKIWGPKVAGLVSHDKIIHLPTANLVEMYGMANGLPIDDPNSGFDERYPFKDRDPRFYHDIVFDGFHFVLAEDKLSDAQNLMLIVIFLLVQICVLQISVVVQVISSRNLFLILVMRVIRNMIGVVTYILIYRICVWRIFI